MKRKLKPPGPKRLKLKYDKVLSSFAFNFNLRRSILDAASGGPTTQCRVVCVSVRRCRSTLSNPC